MFDAERRLRIMNESGQTTGGDARHEYGDIDRQAYSRRLEVGEKDNRREKVNLEVCRDEPSLTTALNNGEARKLLSVK